MGIPYPQLATACAVCKGSRGSGGAGLRLVLTAQNLQPRVQVSPRTMIVAVAMPSPPPFQHSPILGHCASSHTVCSLSPDSVSFTSWYFSPCGAFCLSHPGFLTLGSLPVYGPIPPGYGFSLGFFSLGNSQLMPTPLHLALGLTQENEEDELQRALPLQSLLKKGGEIGVLGK